MPKREKQAAKENRRRGTIFNDPVVRRMGLVAAVVVLLYLATVVGSLFMGLIGPNTAPRTAVEQRLSVSRAEVEAGSQDPVVWAAYIDALIAQKQYSRAQTMIDRAVAAKYEDPTKQYFGLAQASLDLARQNYTQAIKSADTAMKALEKKRDEVVAQYLKDSKPAVMSTGELGDNYYLLLQVKAEAYEKLGKTPEAIAALDTYLVQYPRAADILEWRGDLKVDAGDNQGALVDYKDASQYMPGDTDLEKKIAETGAAQ